MTTQKKSNLKIAIVLNRFYPEVGGAETNLYFQANALAEKYDITVFTPRRLEETPAAETLNGYRIKRLFDILNPFSHYPNIRSKALMPGIFFRILFGKFDIVQVFPSLNYSNILAFAAARLSGKPFVFCSFDFLDYATIIKESDGKIDCEMVKKYTPKYREKYMLKHSSHIFAISNREMDFFKQYNENVSYSPVPVLTEEYEKKVPSPRSEYNLSDKDFIFMSLGRVSSIKGQDLALQAFINIKDEIPSAKFVVVGRDDYEESFIKEMKDKIKSNNIEDRVIFTGMVERDEVIGWLRYCDIHVIPVRFMNSGAVVVETWAAGTPVIQSDAVDPNYVIEGKNGFLFQRENVEMLTEKMLKAFKEKDKFNKMAEEGRKFVMENITYENLISIYSDVYDRITG
jgi:glycosyltransferase involved in cell wall biosynthesis